MSSSSRRIVLTAVIAMGELAGCARVTVEKVPLPTQYDYCEGCPDHNQRQQRADGIKGVRYYLPRAYVAVKKEFPVGGNSYYANGTLSADGLIVVDAGTLPDDLKKFFAKPMPLSETHDARPGAEVTPQSQSGGVKAGGNGKATKDAKTAAPAVTLLADPKDYLAGSSVNHANVPAKDATIEITLKVKKAAIDPADNRALGGAGQLDVSKVYLVPFVAGKQTADVVEVAAVSATGAAGDDRTIVAQVAGAKIPAQASLGAGIDVLTTDAKGAATTKRVVLHTKEPNVFNSFAEAAEPEKTPEAEKTTDTSTEKSLSTASLATSGDPATSPVIAVSDLYDIVLMPDYDEQYAMRVGGGLGHGKADLGLENGWMVEKLQADIDNHELGNFVTKMAEKVVDFGLSRVKPLAAVAAAAKAAPSTAAEQQSESGGQQPARRVSLRVDKVEYAVPGIYPVLKASELKQAASGAGFAAPEIHYREREEITVSVLQIDATGASAGASPAASASATDLADIEAIAKDINTYSDPMKFKTLRSLQICTATAKKLGPALTVTVSLRDATAAQLAAVRKETLDAVEAINKKLADRHGAGATPTITVNSLMFNDQCAGK